MKRLGLILTLLLGSLATFAIAQGGDRQDARFVLAEDRPDRSTGERITIDYKNPDDPEGKPPAVRKVVTVAPKGTSYDPRGPRSCTASEPELIAQGGGACPPGSRVGGGVVKVDTGTPGPERFVVADVKLFNNARDGNGELVYVNTIRDNGGRTVIRANIKGRRTITRIDPPLPGTPPDGGAIDTARLALLQHSRIIDGERHSYIVSPPECPDRGFWQTAVRFTYRDGIRQADRSSSEC